MFKKKNRGFTLIELLVVIAIIGILATVVLASLNSTRTKGRIASMQSGLRNILPDLMICVIDDNDLVAPADATTVCSGSESKYPTRPSAGAWTWASTDLDVGNGTFSFTASGDGVVITCTDTGCTTV